MTKHYETVIIGAGSMGMSAGYQLAKQGVDVLLIDKYNPPHDKGSHFGDTRIIRHAYGEGKEYVPLALRAQELWNDLEKKSHLKIFTQAGSLGFGAKGKTAFIDEAIASGKEYNLVVNSLTATELKENFPGLTLPDDYYGFYEPNSGYLYSENILQAYKELAVHYGADTSFDNSVEDIKSYSNYVEVKTEKGIFSADKLIISAGAWTNQLTAKLELDLPLKPTRQAVAWFEAEESSFNLNSFPTFMADVPGDLNNAVYYGFPSINESGLKVGRHDYIDTVDPDTINREFGFHENDEAHLRDFLNEFMPGAAGKLKKSSICMYTRTPDGHFIIDKHPKCDNVFIAAGFSGHGFKFASVIGEILSEFVRFGKTTHDISLFKINRPSINQND